MTYQFKQILREELDRLSKLAVSVTSTSSVQGAARDYASQLRRAKLHSSTTATWILRLRTFL